MEALALHEDTVVFGQELEQFEVLGQTVREDPHRGLDTVLFEVGQKLQDAVTAGRHLETLNQNQELQAMPPGVA